jgi:hypothetical protein
MFDLIRHGQAHQYQQITADLTDGHWVMSLTGGEFGETLSKVRAQRPLEHLGVGHVDNTLFVVVRPEVMFLDFQDAVRDAGLLGRDDLRLDYMTRSNHRNGVCDFDRRSLWNAFQRAGHVTVGIRGVTDV